MSVETITSALKRVYDELDETIVVWYDEEENFRESYEALQIEGVEKIVAERNLFWIKYRIYYEAPEHKYLVYVPGPKPDNRENWLLDLLLSSYEFKADASSMAIRELGLDLRLKPMLERYAAFFRVGKNREALQALVEPHDDDERLLNKMMAVAVGVKSDDFEELLYALLDELHRGRESRYKKLERFELAAPFWERVEQETGYSHDAPTMMGLVIYLFDNRFRLCVKEEGFRGNKQASLFVNHWMQHVKWRETFRTLSRQVEKELGIEQGLLAGYSADGLLECDTYEAIDRIIIKELAMRLESGGITETQMAEMIDLRKTTFWYEEFADYYDALRWAARFLYLQANLSFEVQSFTQGIEAYTSQWYRFDYAYRKYLYALSRCANSALFDAITLRIEKFYTNRFLTGLSDAWYEELKRLEKWEFEPKIDQKRFYETHVKPLLGEKNKLCVIISDALRYESGKELDERLGKENSIRTEFGHMIASLPSYTQLGMASLLPHERLHYKEGRAEVYADGVSTQGTANRTRVLQNHLRESIAIQASDFLKMKRDEARAFFKPYRLVYIYENSIDARGKPPTEDQVFEATEECFARIARLVKKLHNELQWRNVLITADHGYLYEKSDVDESHFCKVPRDERWVDSNKRMAIGNDLEAAPCVVKYEAKELGVSGDTQFLIAKSMQRIRSKGGGSKFVHGGATLQEIVVPLIKVNRKPELKSRPVDFDVIRSSSMITANVFPVTFIQKEPVREKVLPQHIQVSICSEEGELLSDVHELIFDSRESDPAKMHQRVTFRFSRDLTAFNNQSVVLRVMAKAQGTNEFNKELTDKCDRYTVNISFGAEEW